ncbi:MAG TPA: DUF371 domain-containing protein [Candidatus Nanoarchaeia archaeon]|nr:DUF371 domain-containing protein [Candidatus Nanoarchaeia archaeon]
MKYSFSAFGHPNIRASHPRTFEFTKDPECTPEGDCIVGVAADFDTAAVQKFRGAIVLRIDCGTQREVVHAEVNPLFSHPSELVVRIGEFASDRTFAIRADKAAAQFSTPFKAELRQPNVKITVTIESV